MGWTQTQGLAFCRLIETVAPVFGCHAALTGGLLYRDGERKDCDVILYRIRQVERVDFPGLFDALRPLGISVLADYGWCKKAVYEGKDVDFFDPEADGEYGAYPDFEPVLPKYVP